MDTLKYKELCRVPWSAQMCEAVAHKQGLWWETPLRDLCKAGRSTPIILECAFNWADTPQGYNYWSDIRHGLR